MSLTDKAAARAAQMTGHKKQANGLLNTITSAARRIPGMLRGAASTAKSQLAPAVQAAKQITPGGAAKGLAGAALGNEALSVLNSGTSNLGLSLPFAGKWDPAAQGERIDPRISGWGALGHMAAHPIQSLIGGTGMAGKADPVRVNHQPGGIFGGLGSTGTPTNITYGPNGELMGQATHNVQLELSPAMQHAMNQLRAGQDPASVAHRGFAGAGINPGSIIPQPQKPGLPSRSVTSGAAGGFTRSL